MNIPIASVTKYFDLKLKLVAGDYVETRESMINRLKQLQNEAQGRIEQLQAQADVVACGQEVFPAPPYVGFLAQAAETVSAFAAKLDTLRETTIQLRLMQDALTKQSI